MSDFEEQIQRAIHRGRATRDEQGRIAGEQQATEEELKSRHSELRLALSEHIEACLRQLCDHFPGFEFSTVMNEDGWGARISRDDVHVRPGSSQNRYSRLEMLIRPWSTAGILELTT